MTKKTGSANNGEVKPALCWYFQVHQPYRVKPYQVFDVGNDHAYFDYDGTSDLNNREVLKRVVKKCYLPMGKLLLELVKEHKDFKVSFSLSGLVMEQFERFAPEVIDLFGELADTGQVEFLGETYYHSLAAVYSELELRSQIELHDEKVRKLWGKKPTAFRNTELIYNNDLAKIVESLGYRVILTEGVDEILGERSPNFVYSPAGCEKLALLLKNYRLSDDIAFRFNDQNWKEWPLSAEKYQTWLEAVSGEVVNLFMDFETFGEHQWKDSGIFEFMEGLIRNLLEKDWQFVTVSEAGNLPKVEVLDIPHHVSWADKDRDLSAWIESSMQRSALEAVYALKDEIVLTENVELLHDWRRLQTSDHFYYMATKYYEDGKVHDYFSPYESAYDAFTNYMNVLHDVRYRIKQLTKI